MTNVSHITKLLMLEDGWDSYGGKAPTKEAVLAALEYVLTRNGVGIGPTILPEQWFAVPGGDGSVQLEYHAGDFHAEILFNPVGEIDISIRSADWRLSDSRLQGAIEINLGKEFLELTENIRNIEKSKKKPGFFSRLFSTSV